MKAFVVKGVSVKVLRSKIPEGTEALITGMNTMNLSGKKNVPPVIIQSTNALIVSDTDDLNWLSKENIQYTPYEYGKNFLPKENQEWTIHISNFPNTWTLDQVRKFLRGYLCRVFKTNWRMYFPVDKESGLVKGHGTIRMNEEYEKTLTDEEKCDFISLMKLSLHNKNVQTGYYLNARWSEKNLTSTGVKGTWSKDVVNTMVGVNVTDFNVSTSDVGVVVAPNPTPTSCMK